MDIFTDAEGNRIHVHPESECRGDEELGCPLHHPSSHPLVDCGLVFDVETSMFHRVMPDGQKIPDPDSLAFYYANRNAVECLLCNTVIESKYRHNYVTCPCGNIAVDGGDAYKRRIGVGTNYREL